MSQSALIPKDLSQIESKVFLNLTKRQILCFTPAVLLGVPLFFATRKVLSNSAAALVMILVMMPFFFLAMYRHNEEPMEVYLKHLIQTKYIRPANRPYMTENVYTYIQEELEREKEVKKIVAEAKKDKKGRIREFFKLPTAKKPEKRAAGQKLSRREQKLVSELYNRKKKGKKVISAQQTIPYERIWPDGLCRLPGNLYSRTIEFEDINYQLASDEDQKAALSRFWDFYNYFDSGVNVQLSLISHFINRQEWEKNIDIAPKDDAFNEVRREYTKMLKEKFAYGNNGIRKTKLLTLSVQASNEREARLKLGGLETDAVNNLKLLGASARVLNGRQRLKILFDMMHPEGERFDFEWKYLPESGLSTKDFIVPSSFSFGKSRQFSMGDHICRASYLQILAPKIDDRILKKFLDTEDGIVINIHVKGIDQAEAIKLIKRKITDIDAMKIQEQKRASRDGYDRDIIPSDINSYGADARVFLECLTDDNQKMFLVTVIIVNNAKNMRNLNAAVAKAADVANQYNCRLLCLDFQQENGFVSSLPLGLNRINIQRGLTTKGTAIFVPFTTHELFQGGEALYYGLNALSGNMIMADRKNLKNPNGLILGTPGSGKSFAAKREIANAFLVTDDDIIICDPESEYSALVEQLHGQIITVSSASRQYVNPLDINLDYSDEDSPLALKSDFILSFCETLKGPKGVLDPVEKTVIDRSVHKIYQEYLIDPVPEKMPLLSDLYEEIKRQPEDEAKRLAATLELYVNGSLNVFNHRTNVDIHNRLVCFDIKELGKQLKQLGMLVIQDQVWNRVTRNRAEGKSTRYYIDEFHLLLSGEVASWSVEIWKRFRKWGGIPTGITQNIKDFLHSPEVENIFENSDFVLMLNQGADDRAILEKHLTISPEQLKYVTYSEAGEGLLFYGNVILPFADHFPKDTLLYRIMTTRVSENEKLLREEELKREPPAAEKESKPEEGDI